MGKISESQAHYQLSVQYKNGVKGQNSNNRAAKGNFAYIPE